MAGSATEPRDIPECAGPEHAPQASPGHEPGRWEREAEEHHRHTGPEDAVTKSSRIYFFIMLAIIAAAIAVFLILRPQ